jgi:hypothetical protein
MRRLFPFIFFLAVLCACNGPDPAADVFLAPEILDISAEKGEDYSQLVLTCRVSSGNGIKDYGFYFGLSEKDYGFYFGPGEMVKMASPSPIQDNEFTLTVTGLTYCTEYRYKAFIDSGPAEVVSEIKLWRTEDEIPPVPRLGILEQINVGFIVHCDVYGYDDVVRKDAFECGVCYKQDGTVPDLDGPHGTGKIHLNSTNLYHDYTVTFMGLHNSICFRPYTKIGPMVSYGESISYTLTY